MKQFFIFWVIIIWTLLSVSTSAYAQESKTSEEGISPALIENTVSPWQDDFAISGANFVSGGIGQEERALLKTLEPEFNLRIEMAHASGPYIGDGNLTIKNSDGQIVIDTVTDGPLFYAKLPAGRYTIDVRISSVVYIILSFIEAGRSVNNEHAQENTTHTT